MEIRKAVIPAAGWGMRFLPSTKAVPKAMLPVVDKPLVQYAVEEAFASGIEQVIVVTPSARSAIEGHFDPSPELERALQQKGEERLLGKVRRLADLGDVCCVRQKEPLGLGDAVLTAREMVGDEPFAVLLPDDIFDADIPLLQQMLQVYRRHKGSVLALWRVSKENTRRYGIVTPKPLGDRVFQVLDVVEKPNAEDAPSDLAIMGRYILTPEVFETLQVTPRGKGGEVQLTDGLALLLGQQAVYGYEFEGIYHDAGTPLSLLKASLALALKSPETGAELREYLKSLAAEL